MRIQKKFLTKSESAESGWMARQSAPYVIVKGEKDDFHAKVKRERMSARDLESALAEELDAEFINEVTKVGPAEAFNKAPEKRERYLAIMKSYIEQSRTEMAAYKKDF